MCVARRNIHTLLNALGVIRCSETWGHPINPTQRRPQRHFCSPRGVWWAQTYERQKKKGHAPFCRRTKRTTATRLDVLDRNPDPTVRSLITAEKVVVGRIEQNLSTSRNYPRPPGVESPRRPPQPKRWDSTRPQERGFRVALVCT